MTVWKENRFGFMSIAGVCVLNMVTLGVVAGSKFGTPSVASPSSDAPAITQSQQAPDPVKPDTGPGNPLANLPSSDSATPSPSPAPPPSDTASTPDSSSDANLDAPVMTTPPQKDSSDTPPAEPTDPPSPDTVKIPDTSKSSDTSAAPVVIPIPASSSPAEKTPAETSPAAGDASPAQPAAPAASNAPVAAPIVTH